MTSITCEKVKRGYTTGGIQPKDIHQRKMLELQDILVTVEEDRARGRCGISLDELDHRLGIVLGEELP